MKDGLLTMSLYNEAQAHLLQNCLTHNSYWSRIVSCVIVKGFASFVPIARLIKDISPGVM